MEGRSSPMEQNITYYHSVSNDYHCEEYLAHLILLRALGILNGRGEFTVTNVITVRCSWFSIGVKSRYIVCLSSAGLQNIQRIKMPYLAKELAYPLEQPEEQQYRQQVYMRQLKSPR